MMRRNFFILLLSLAGVAGCASVAKRAPSRHYTIECSILDSNGKIIRAYGGSRCTFFSDGSIASGSWKQLTFYNPDMSVRWKKDISTHHQLNHSGDGKNILVMSSRVHVVNKEKMRFDLFQVYDRDGRLLKSMDLYDHREELWALAAPAQRKPLGIEESMRKHTGEDVAIEFAHSNTFAEIQENELGKTNPIFAKGNYILNLNGPSLVIVMDSELKKILWSMRQYSGDGLDPTWHDVQLSEKGHILIYNNNAGIVKGLPVSALEEINPVTGKSKILFKGNSEERFYSEFCGGLQVLSNGNILYSEIEPYGRVTEITPSGEIVWRFDNPNLDDVTKKPDIFQQVRSVDLSSFLQYNSGL